MGNLLHYALVFLVVALVAAAVGFGGVAGFAMDAARLLFWVFIVLFVVSLVAGLVEKGLTHRPVRRAPGTGRRTASGDADNARRQTSRRSKP